MRNVYKKGMAIFLILMMVVGGLNGLFIGGSKAHAAVAFAGGTGSESDPYLIGTAVQLNEIREREYVAANKYFKLIADIELGDYDWVPIGEYDDRFYGNLDGNGFKIMNLTLDLQTPEEGYNLGLFGVIGSNSSITNIIMDGVNLNGYSRVGGLAGENYGTISNSSVTGSVSSVYNSNSNTGGLVGINGGTINNSYSSANVIGNVSGGYSTGGLVGNNNQGFIRYSYATGNVSGFGSIGGLVGSSNQGSISNSYATGNVTGNEFVGGLVGENSSSISKSYAVGSVVGSTNAGGLVGNNTATISSSFYDTVTTGFPVNFTGKGTGKSTDEMKLQSTYPEDDWNFEDDWYIIPGQYPQLWYTALTPGPDTGTTKLNYIMNGMEYSINGGGSTTVTNNTYYRILPVDAGNIITVSVTGAIPANQKTFRVGKMDIKPPDSPTAVMTIGTDDIGTTKLTNVTSAMEYKVKLGGTYVTIATSSVDNIAVDVDDQVYVRVKETATQPASTAQILKVDLENIKIGPLVAAIAGVTVPAAFGTPVLNPANAQYTTWIEWSPAPADGVFVAGISYVATITLTPKTGNTFSELPVDFFTVAGATDTISTIDGVVIAEFPPAGPAFAGGDGTSGNPYQIADGVQLDKIRYFLSSSFMLIDDIDLSSYVNNGGWSPIGNDSGGGDFKGEFNGNNFTINHLTIDRPNESNVGLFKFANGVSTFNNIKLENVNITGNENVGGLVGINAGEINNSYASGFVKAEENHSGGLVGTNENDGTIINSYAAVNVNGPGYVGGLVGSNNGSISDSFATGNVAASEEESDNGGLVGNNDEGDISNSFATGNVDAIGEESVNGGLVGDNGSGQVEASYATGDVNGGEETTNGGLIGSNESGSVSDSYAQGSVSGDSSINGGLVGRNPTGTINNSYAIGYVSGLGSENGDLVGISDGSITGSFYGTMDQEVYSDWDSDLWGFNASRNGGYPYLQPIQVYVEYDGNGNNGAPLVDTQSYMPGSLVSVSTELLVKDNHVFLGWYKQADGNGDLIADTFVIESDTTLYADWLEINKETLNIAIESATNTKTSAVEGTLVGQFTTDAIATLGTAITNATQVADDTTANQATVDAAVTALNTAVNVFVATAVPAPSKTALNSAIISATSVKTEAVIGTQVGQYSTSAVATLGTAITNATEAANNTTYNQVTVDAAVTALNTAVSTFVASAVTTPGNTGTPPVTTPTTATATPTPTPTPTVAPTPTPAPTIKPTEDVTVDSNANVVETVTGSDGKVTTSVTQDAAKLADAFEKMQGLDDNTGTPPSVTITGNNATGTAIIFNIPSAALSDAALTTPDAIVNFISADGGYSLPVSILDFAAIARSLGTGSDNVTIQVNISIVDSEMNARINTLVQSGNTKQLGTAIEFSVTATGNGKTVELNNFGSTYVERNVVLDTTVDSTHTTVVLYDPNTGQFSFVPAIFERQADNSTIVRFKRNGNSIYTVLSSTETFDDITTHWAKSDIELLASKLIVNGVTASGFAPNSNITRAEFAALLVRSLGLTLDASSAAFTDVKSSDWYAGAIGAAVKAKLVDGFNDNSFKPNATITREQMAVMVSRAIIAAGKTSDIAGTQNEILASFQDSSSISSWAQTAVAQSVKAKIITGMTDKTFVPSANATRAQAVVMLKRLLQYTGFIN